MRLTNIAAVSLFTAVDIKYQTSGTVLDVMKNYVGLDIGSVNVKLCLVDEKGTVLNLLNEKITSNARAAVNALLRGLGDLSGVAAIGVSGSGKAIVT